MPTSAESSSVHICMSHIPRIPRIQVLPFLKALPGLAVPQGLQDLPNPAWGCSGARPDWCLRICHTATPTQTMFYTSL